MTQSIPQLPELPLPSNVEVTMGTHRGSLSYYTAQDMQDYARSALSAQPLVGVIPELREVKAAGPEDMKIYNKIAAGALNERAPSRPLSETWDGDRRDQWTDEIDEAHPMHSGAHEAYAMALEMVGARKSKYALVDLVCWLLQKSTLPIGPSTKGVDHG